MPAYVKLKIILKIVHACVLHAGPTRWHRSVILPGVLQIKVKHNTTSSYPVPKLQRHSSKKRLYRRQSQQCLVIIIYQSCHVYLFTTVENGDWGRIRTEWQPQSWFCQTGRTFSSDRQEREPTTVTNHRSSIGCESERDFSATSSEPRGTPVEAATYTPPAQRRHAPKSDRYSP